jgi:hypothetical protein
MASSITGTMAAWTAELQSMSYLPEYNVGYFYSINSANGAAFGKIGDAIRAYITRNLTKPTVPAAGQLPSNAQEWTGWYEANAMRMKMQEFIAPLAMQRLRFKDGELQFSSYGPSKQSFIPVSGLQFRYKPDKGPAEPVATAALLAPNSEGRFVFIGTTYQAHPRMAGVEPHRVDDLVPACLRLHPPLCALLDLRRTHQAPPPSRAHDAPLAADCRSEPAGVYWSRHSLRQ